MKDKNYYRSFEPKDNLKENGSPMTVQEIIIEEHEILNKRFNAVEKKEVRATALACLSYAVVLWYLYLIFVEAT